MYFNDFSEEKKIAWNNKILKFKWDKKLYIFCNIPDKIYWINALVPIKQFIHLPILVCIYFYGR